MDLPLRSLPAVIAVIDDYENRVGSLQAFRRLRAALPAADIRVVCAQPLDAAATESLRDVEYLVLIRERTRITEELLERLPLLKALVQTGTAGQPETSHIDLAACARRGITILEGGVSGGHSAAEVAWALILAARRQLCGYVQSMQRGDWQRGNKATTLARSLRGDTLGILGYGRIGQLIGGYGTAFGMSVLVWGSENSRVAAQRHEVQFASSREALFAQSDVLTLQLRLNAGTRHSVTLQDLSVMKPTSLLVNTARPALLAPGSLETALKAGRPGSAANDVHDMEPVLAATELTRLPICLATTHIGYVEAHSYEILFGAAFAVLEAHLLREKPARSSRPPGSPPHGRSG